MSAALIGIAVAAPFARCLETTIRRWRFPAYQTGYHGWFTLPYGQAADAPAQPR